MAIVSTAEFKVGNLRAGTATRVSFAPSNTVAINTTDYVSTETGAGGFRLATLVYARQDVATTQSIQGHEAYAQANHPSGTVVGVYAAIGNAENAGAGLVTTLRGGSFGAGTSGTGNATTAAAIVAQSCFRTGSGTIGTAVGLRVEAQTVGTTNYAIETLGDAPVILGGDLRATGEVRSGANSWHRGGTTNLIRFNTSSRVEINANSQPLELSALPTTVNVGVPGAAQALPTNPVTYMRLRVGGADYVVPLYNVP
jgi:hypothetical protein